MKIIAHLNRFDIVRMSLYLVPRMKLNWIILVVIWLLLVAQIISKTGIPDDLTLTLVLLCLLCSFVGAIFITMLLFLIGTLVIIIQPQVSSVIGRHEYEITEQGFIERNGSAETLSFWQSIKTIKLAGPYIFVQISPILYVIIPKRAFETDQSFKDFYQILNQHWNAASA